MANTFRTASVIVQEAALQLYNKLQIGAKVHRYTQSEYVNKGHGKPGPTINVPMPIRYLAQDGPVLVRQPIIERTLPVTIDQDKHVGLDMTVFDQTINTDDDITRISSKYIQPAVEVLADAVDDYLMGLYSKLYNYVGVADTVPGSGTAAATLQLFADAKRIMVEAGVPREMEKNVFLDAQASGYVPIALSGLFVKEAQQAVSRGRIGGAGGFNFYESANVRTHTAGTLDGTPLTDGDDQIGSTLALDGFSGSTDLNEGDIIYIGAIGTGPQPVNVSNKRAFDRLQAFVVTADTAESGNAIAALPISPSIVIEGAYQNCNIAVAGELTPVLIATHRAHMAITRETFCLATVPLKPPRSAMVAEVGSYEGISLLLTAAYDIENRQETARLDIIFGGRELYPETGVRILG